MGIIRLEKVKHLWDMTWPPVRIGSTQSFDGRDARAILSTECDAGPDSGKLSFPLCSDHYHSSTRITFQLWTQFQFKLTFVLK